MGTSTHCPIVSVSPVTAVCRLGGVQLIYPASFRVCSPRSLPTAQFSCPPSALVLPIAPLLRSADKRKHYAGHTQWVFCPNWPTLNLFTTLPPQPWCCVFCTDSTVPAWREKLCILCPQGMCWFSGSTLCSPTMAGHLDLCHISRSSISITEKWYYTGISIHLRRTFESSHFPQAWVFLMETDKLQHPH